MEALPPSFKIRQVPRLSEALIIGLSELLCACVDGGASVSFMWPFSRDRAETFWRKIAYEVMQRQRLVLVAEDPDGRIVGTVQLVLTMPENQPHRAEVAKMLVHPSARRQGLGATLLVAVEQAALAAGKTLLLLDTVTGDEGDRLYTRAGWQRLGSVPDYAYYPDGRLCAATIFYKSLKAPPPSSGKEIHV